MFTVLCVHVDFKSTFNIQCYSIKCTPCVMRNRAVFRMSSDFRRLATHLQSMQKHVSDHRNHALSVPPHSTASGSQDICRVGHAAHQALLYSLVDGLVQTLVNWLACGLVGQLACLTVQY